jgi:hypothetical protein
MKANRNTPEPARREIFVLTPEEKTTVCFVLIAFVLGLATKYYRDAHPAPVSKPATAARGDAIPTPSPASHHEMSTQARPKL